MRVLNLYSGIGGNRKLWKDVDVTAVEYTPKIARVYQDRNPQDLVVIADAHEYLIKHFSRFDFIWSSPPCQSHSKMIRGGRNRTPCYPDLKLYEEILFLKHNYCGPWVVENVVPYYAPLVPPTTQIGRHLFWSNFPISSSVEVPVFKNFINRQDPGAKNQLHDWLGIHYEGNVYYENNHCTTQVLRNCVHPAMGLHVLECARTQVNKTKIAAI